MKMRFPAAAAAFLAAFALGSAQAQIGDGSELNLFISPCGEPFTAPVADPYPVVKWFKQADANNDGKIDIDEMRADATHFFTVLDRDGNGVISNQEVTWYEENMVPSILHVGALEGGVIRVVLQPGGAGIGSIDPGGASPGDTPIIKGRLNEDQGAVPFSLFREPEPVRSADRNFDYTITLKEFQDQSDRHFHALDKKEQGYLTLADLPKTEMERRFKTHR
jgi:hypothetical protein